MDIDNIDFTNMSDKELKEIEGTIQSLIHKEWARRETIEPAAWECRECGYEHTDSNNVYEHLRNVHGYPEEDASISIRPIYIK